MTDRWDAFGQHARQYGAPQVTTTAPVGEWVAAVPPDLLKAYAAQMTAAERAVRLCGLGVAATDAQAYARREQEQRRLPSLAVPGMVRYGLGGMAVVAPDCPVRDALGWLLAPGITAKTLVDLPDETKDYVDTAAVWAGQWFAAGFEHDDYVYAAAGLSIEETLAGIRAGTVDRQAALTLAALRGVALPAG